MSTATTFKLIHNTLYQSAADNNNDNIINNKKKKLYSPHMSQVIAARRSGSF